MPDFPTDGCQSRRCPEQPQHLVEVAVGEDGADVLGLCAIHTWLISRRDRSDNVVVIGP